MPDQPILKFEDILFVIGGLALFLYGMQHIGSSLKNIAGGTLRNVLAKLTQNRLLAMMSGALVTIGLQSSGATTLFLVGLTEAGMIDLYHALGVILGADIGTTITVQLVAFNLFAYSPIALLIGWIWGTFGRTARSRAIGRIVLGAGLLFFGMGIMSSKMAPLGKVPVVAETLASFASRPWLGIIVAAGFTALVRSSATTIVLALGLAQAGIIGINEAFPIILGANVGTCSTALIATIGMGRKGWRIALAHIFFKIVGTMIIYPFLTQAGDVVVSMNDAFSGGAGRLVANAHTAFNLFVALFFLPFTGIVASILMKLLPERPKGEGVLKHIRPDSEIIPETALSTVKLEIGEVANRLRSILADSHSAVLDLDEHANERVTLSRAAFQDHVDNINDYIFRIRNADLNQIEREQCLSYLWAARSFHHCMVILTGPIMDMRQRLSVATSHMPMEAVASVRAMFNEADSLLDSTLDTLSGQSSSHTPSQCRKILDEAMSLHELRIKRGVPGSSETSFLFSEAMLNLYSLAKELESLNEHLSTHFSNTGRK